MRLVELIIFEPWREKIIIFPYRVDLLSFIISNTDKHEFASIWRWIRCCNDVMNNVDYVIKRDIYQQKMLSCSKNIRGISVFVLKIRVVDPTDIFRT